MARTKSITETGPKALRGIRNPDLYSSLSLGLSDIELQGIKDEFARSVHANYNAAHGHIGYLGLSDQSLYTPQVTPELDYGSSVYDDSLLLDPVQQDIDNYRAENQSVLAKAAAGIAKGIILAGTTFIDGTVGLLTGLGQGVYNAFDGDENTSFSQGLWDNPVTNLMGQLNNAAEKELVNYRTEEEINGPWYSLDNLTSANFIFDTVIKNMGFTVGAAFSGGVYTKAISWGAKALGMARLGLASTATIEAGQKAMQAARATRATKALVGSFFSAHAEAVLEAYNSSQDFIMTSNQAIDSRVAELKGLAMQEFIDSGGSILADGSPNPASDPEALRALNAKLQLIDLASDAARQEAVKQSKNVGTMDGLLNIPILWLSNVAMFGKMYSGGWKAARNASKTTTRATKQALKEAEAAAKAGDPTKMQKLEALVAKAEETGYQGLTQTEKSMVEEVAPHILGKKMGATWAAIKGPLREGNEEMMQGAAAQAAHHRYENEVDRIFDSKMDIESTYKTRGFMESVLHGFKNQYGDIDNYEEAFVGAITGLLGSPTFGKGNNSTDQTYLGKSKWIGLSGGTFTEVRDYLRDRKNADIAAQHATEVLRRETLSDDIRHLIAQTHFSDTMDRAIIHDDEKEYKDARTASIFEMVNHLKRADRLDLLQRAMETTTEFTDEDIAEIAESVSKEVSATTPDITAKVQQKKKVEKEIETMLDGYEELYEEAMATGDSSKIDATSDMLEQKKAELAQLEAEIEQAKPVSVSPYIHKDGTAFTADEIKQDIDKRVNQFQKIIDTISLSQDLIDEATSGTLTNEQLDTLTWYKVMMSDWSERADGITDQWKDVITKLANDPSLVSSLEAIQEVEDLLEEAGFNPKKAGIQLGGRFDLLKRIKNYSRVLQQLQQAVETGGLNLAYLLTSTLKPEGSEETVGDIISKQLEQVLQGDTSMSKDIKDAFLKNLNDLKSIGQGHRRYNELLDEYLKNPEKIDQAHLASANSAEAESSRRSLSSTIDGVDWNSPAGTIAKYLKDNASKIQNAGGFEKFIENLTLEQKRKAREAQLLVMGIDSLDSLIDLAGLEDEQAQILRSIIEDSIDDADTVKKLADSVKEAIQGGAVEELIRNSVPEEQPEDLTLRQIEAAEVALSEFMDANSKKLVDAAEEAQRAIDTEQEKVRQLAEKTEESPNEVSKLAKKTKESEGPAEAPSEDRGEEPSGDEEAVNPTTPTAAKLANERSSKSPQVGLSGFNRRRQVSLYYLLGKDKETLPKHYEEHPEDIPAGVDKDAFLKYIKAVHKKLVESGAYTYISGVNPNLRLKEGQEIRFTTDAKLNEEAGVPVILMVVTDELGHDLIIGSLPTSLDFQAKQRGNAKTVGEAHPEDKALYDALVDELISKNKNEQTQAKPKEMPKGSRSKLGLPAGPVFRADKKVDDEEARFESVESNEITYFEPTLSSEAHVNTVKSTDAYGHAVEFIGGDKREATELIVVEPGEAAKDENGKLKITKKAKVFAVTPNTPFVIQEESRPNVSSITTKVEALRGGHPSLSSLNRSVSEVFRDNPIPITIVLAKGPRSSKAVRSPLDLADPINGLVYVYVTSNTGAQIPLLCFSTPLKDLATNDWYIELTIAALQKLADGVNLGSSKDELLRWLPFLDNLHINVSEKNGKKSIILGWGRNKEGKIANTYSLRILEDGSISNNDALQFVKSIAGKKITLPSGEKIYPTTNVDRNLINNQEYLSNISRYIKINVTSDSPRTIDDWFTYEPTELLKLKKKPSSTNPAVTPSGKSSTEETVETPEGQASISSAGTVSIEGDKELSEAEEEAILAAVPKGVDAGNIDKKPTGSVIEGAFGSAVSDIDEMPDTSRRRRRRKPKESAPVKDEVDEYIDKLNQLEDLQKEAATIHELAAATAKEENEKRIKSQSYDELRHSYNSLKRTAAAHRDAGRVALAEEMAALAAKYEEEMSIRVARGDKDAPPFMLVPLNSPQEQLASTEEVERNLEKIATMFPKLAREGRIVLVKGLLNVVDRNGNPRQAYGMFRNGVLYISDLSPKGTAFHEAFHYIADTLLTDSEWETMFDEASKLWGNLPEIGLEENLAEAFREFMNEREDHSVKGRLKNIFQKLKHIILSISGKENYLDNLFWSIYRNKMQNRNDNIVEDTFKQELLEYKTKKLKYSNLDQETKDYLAARKFSEENYEKLSIEQKEILLQCM